jgi:hypothetical protein
MSLPYTPHAARSAAMLASCLAYLSGAPVDMATLAPPEDAPRADRDVTRAALLAARASGVPVPGHVVTRAEIVILEVRCECYCLMYMFTF